MRGGNPAPKTSLQGAGFGQHVERDSVENRRSGSDPLSSFALRNMRGGNPAPKTSLQGAGLSQHVEYNVDDYAHGEDWFDEDGEGDKTITLSNQMIVDDLFPPSPLLAASNQHQNPQGALGTQDQSISLDPDVVVNYYNTPKGPKRGRERADSSESRQSKIHRRSTSHSTAPTVPSTKISTRTHSRDQSVSPVDENDLRGASRITGGIFRGKARGNNFNFADKGMIFLLYNNFSNIYLLS
jgi:hypothetical protein